jgi:hypothetical protein
VLYYTQCQENVQRAEVHLSFLNLRHQVGMSDQLHTMTIYPRHRAPGTHWTGVWVGLRDSADVVEKLKICPSWELKPYFLVNQPTA